MSTLSGAKVPSPGVCVARGRCEGGRGELLPSLIYVAGATAPRRHGAVGNYQLVNLRNIHPLRLTHRFTQRSSPTTNTETNTNTNTDTDHSAEFTMFATSGLDAAHIISLAATKLEFIRCPSLAILACSV